MAPTILVIDDEERHRSLYAQTLSGAGFKTLMASSAEEAGEVMAAAAPDMIISDVRMPGADGISFLRSARKTHPNLPFLLVTAFADVRDAVKALKMGAVDYLRKPIDLDELVAAARDALGVSGDNAPLDIPPELMEGIIAASPETRAIFADAYRVARSDATVLVLGESGSGKEVLARFIHNASARAKGPFVALNCAAVPENILASELFGHVRGAFTGASRDRDGLFRAADSGSFFLDEIGDMPLTIQPALLRAIETGTVTPVGSDRERKANVRLIAATNKCLEERARTGEFREDLYYRLNVIAFELPPLRCRREDIAPLARRFLSVETRSEAKRLSPAALAIIEAYSWPGNVRELANAMSRASILSGADVILPEHLPPAVRAAGATMDSAQTTQPVKTMIEAENEAIRSALLQTNGNRTKAAELLGISRRALIYKLKRL